MSLEDSLVEEVSKRYMPIHEAFKGETFKRQVLEGLFGNRRTMLVIEPDPQLRIVEAGDLGLPFAIQNIEFCIDQVRDTSPEHLLKLLFDEYDLSHYDLLYISPTLDKGLTETIQNRITTDQIDVKVITLNQLEKIYKQIPMEQRYPSQIYTPEKALAQLQRVTDCIKSGKDDGILEVLNLDSILSQIIDPDFRPTTPIARGERAAPGAASAPCFTNLEQALNYIGKNRSRKVIFVTDRLTSQHTDLFPYIAGLITSEKVTEGTHINIFLSSLGIPCVSECEMHLERRGVHFGKTYVENGTNITIDGSRGEVFREGLPMVDSPIIQDVEKAMNGEKYEPCKETRIYREFLEQVQRIIKENNGMDVYLFASNKNEARLAKILSTNGGTSIVRGVGMVKTETQFIREKSKSDLYDLLLGKDHFVKREARKKMLNMQHQSFYEILREMGGMPVQIRLLDSLGELFQEGPLHSDNPLDLRGPDISLQYPEIYNVQIEAIIKAAYNLRKHKVQPRIVIPYIRNEKDVEIIQEMISSAYKRTKIRETELNIRLGVMIETPSAVDRIPKLYAKGASFFVFGTNDLTSSYLCLPRGRPKATLLRAEAGIYTKDPFENLVEPVKKQISAAVAVIHRLGKDISFGVTGRHARHPQSIIYFHNIGMQYVAVTPYDIPKTLHNVAKAAYMNPRD